MGEMGQLAPVVTHRLDHRGDPRCAFARALDRRPVALGHTFVQLVGIAALSRRDDSDDDHPAGGLEHVTDNSVVWGHRDHWFGATGHRDNGCRATEWNVGWNIGNGGVGNGIVQRFNRRQHIFHRSVDRRAYR